MKSELSNKKRRFVEQLSNAVHGPTPGVMKCRLILVIFYLFNGPLTLSIIWFGFQIAPNAAAASSSSQQPALRLNSKKEILARLKSLHQSHSRDIKSLEEAIRRTVATLASQSGPAGISTLNSSQLKSMIEKIEDLVSRRDDSVMRREIYDRLIFAADSKWAPQPAASFLKDQLVTLALNDLLDPKGTRLWKTYLNLSVVAGSSPDAGEDALSLIDGYLRFSRFEDPRTPEEYESQRSYLNSHQSEPAQSDQKSLPNETNLNPTTTDAAKPTESKAQLQESPTQK